MIENVEPEFRVNMHKRTTKLTGAMLKMWGSAVKDVSGQVMNSAEPAVISQALRLFTMAIMICVATAIGADALNAAGNPPTQPANAKSQLSETHKAEVVQRVARSETKPPVPERGGPQTEPNVILRAAMAPGSALLREGLSWRILKEQNGKAEQQLVWSGGGAEPQILLEPGRYYVEAVYGLAKNGQALEVPSEKKIEPVVPLNAGTIIVKGVAVASGPALNDMFFALEKKAANGQEAQEIGRSTLSKAVFHVPAGEYRLTAKHGLASTDIAVTVEAGKEVRTEAVMNSGELKLSAQAKKDAPPLSGTTFFIFENGDAGNQKEIIRSKLAEPLFSLPAGHYRVAAVLGLARVEREVTIEPGNRAHETLVLNTGGVRLHSQIDGNTDDIEEAVLYRVYSLSSENTSASQALTTSTLPTPTLFLNQGRYRVESQYGWNNARQSQEVDVVPGEVLDVTFKHKVSKVTLKLVPKAGDAPMEKVKWTVKYSDGGTVLISQDAAPQLVLQIGKYQATAQQNGKAYSRTFEATANHDQLVELIAE